MPAETIDGVIDELGRIVDRAEREASRIGYFAALYREVTRRVREGIAEGRFEDPARMEELDVVFANRYLRAHDRHRHGGTPTRSWAVAFAASERWSPLVLQHLLLGMNAHINLDLGIAAARVSTDGDVDALHADFLTINEILSRMIDGVQGRLAPHSPWMGGLDRLAGEADEVISNFCLRRAREDAWSFALELDRADDEDRPSLVARKDEETADRAEEILAPGGRWLAPVRWALRLRESGTPEGAIRTLSDWS